MRCRYCSNRVKATDIVCKGCSAPIPKVNHASGWAFAFSIISLLFSALSVYNIIFLFLGLIFILVGFHLTKKREGKGKTICRSALIIWIASTVATVAITAYYVFAFDSALHIIYGIFPVQVGEQFKQWFSFLGSVVNTL